MKKIHITLLTIFTCMLTNISAQNNPNNLLWDFNPEKANKVSFGCTSLRIKDQQSNVYHGRTLEYASDLPFDMTYYPVGYSFQYYAPDNKAKGLSYTTKYEILALTYPASEFFNPPAQGVNSAGLSASLNMKPDSQLPALKPDQYPTCLNWALAIEWALANCGSVAEVKEKIGGVTFWTEGSPFSVMIEFHYVFYDNTGACLVVEVSDGKIHLYDNPTGVLTNAPEFPWHLTNLNNYTNLTNVDVSTATLGDMKLQQPDAGIATSGLPSSNTSVGRFIRAVFYSTFALKGDTPQNAMIELSHVMNKFDRPKNMTRAEIGEAGGSSSGGSEYTEWTSLTDLKNQELHLRTYYELNYTKYSIKDYTSGGKKVVIPIIK